MFARKFQYIIICLLLLGFELNTYSQEKLVQFENPVKQQSPLLTETQIQAMQLLLAPHFKSVEGNPEIRNLWMRTYMYQGDPNKFVNLSDAFYRAMQGDDDQVPHVLGLLATGDRDKLKLWLKMNNACKAGDDRACQKIGEIITSIEYQQAFQHYLDTIQDSEYPNGLIDVGKTTIYIKPIGELKKAQHDTMLTVAEFLSIFYGIKVVVLPSISVDNMVKDYGVHKRFRDDLKEFGGTQLLAPDITDLFLGKIQEEKSDAAAVIGVTAIDLYPNEEWNYVFGMSSDVYRANVWSMARFDTKDPNALLNLSLRIAKHELGHSFTISHCTRFSCGINGYMNLEDLMQSPIHFCPDDIAKLWWVTKADPIDRYTKLVAFAEKYQLDKAQIEFWKKMRQSLSTKEISETK